MFRNPPPRVAENGRLNVSNDLYEGPGMTVTVDRPNTTGVRAEPFRDWLAGHRVPAGFGLDLPAGSIAWATLLDRVTLLSAREMEVLLLLGTGASNRTIAGRLAVAERTVKAHVAQVMAKLAVESRLQAGLVSLVFQLLREGPPAGSDRRVPKPPAPE
jgi:DNA-binding CsgD family transcriptional regulator